jgi:hypothetical protein
MAADQKSKPGFLHRLRDKQRTHRARTAQRAHEATRRKEPRPDEQRRNSGVGNTGFGGM